MGTLSHQRSRSPGQHPIGPEPRGGPGARLPHWETQVLSLESLIGWPTCVRDEGLLPACQAAEGQWGQAPVPGLPSSLLYPLRTRSSLRNFLADPRLSSSLSTGGAAFSGPSPGFPAVMLSHGQAWPRGSLPVLALAVPGSARAGVGREGPPPWLSQLQAVQGRASEGAQAL